MDNYLICDCHLFLPTKIYRVVGETVELISDKISDNLGNFLAETCYYENCHLVKFKGNKTYLKKVIREMVEVAICKYNDFCIESEII